MKHIFNFILVFFVINCLGQQNSTQSPSSAQILVPYNGSCVINGVTVTLNAPAQDPYGQCTLLLTPYNNNNCSPSAAFTGSRGKTNFQGPAGAINLTFSQPIVSIRIPLSCFDNIPNISLDQCNVFVNGGGIRTYEDPCGVALFGNGFYCTLPEQGGDVAVTIKSTLPFTTMTLQSGGDSAFFLYECNTRDIATCAAGVNAPLLSTATITNSCPNIGVNLNSITATNTPANTTLTWHTVTPVTGANQVANPTAAPAGTYYAAFYDTANNCYSPTSTAVTATTTNCVCDLSVIKTVNNENPLPGSTIVFTLTAQNLGPNPAGGVNVRDVLPSGYTLVSTSQSVGTWNAPDWTIGNLAVNATATMTMTVVVNPTATGSFSNKATISYNQLADPNSSNNVGGSIPRTTFAAPDNFTIVGCATGGVTPSVLSNDRHNGSSPISSTNATLTLVNNGGITGLILNSNGTITVPAGIPIGVYTVTYGICMSSFPLSCNQGTVTITLANNPMNAVADNFSSTPINTLVGGLTPTVLTNDLVNGVVASTTNALVGFASCSPPILPLPTITSAGQISIPPGVTIGTYTITYSLTESSCPANTVTGQATVVVNEQIILTPQIASGRRANNVVNNIDVQGDGKIIITGWFTSYNGVPCNGIARLNTDLTLDTSSPQFITTGAIPSTVTGAVLDMKVIKNSGIHYNKILVCGFFNGFSGVSTSVGIARLNPDGTVDPTFNQAYTGPIKGIQGSNKKAYCMYVYPDGTPNAGKILLAGMFDTYNDTPMGKIVRLNVDGSIDTNFNPNIISPNPINYAGAGFNVTPNVVTVDTNGKILCGGYFTNFNGYPISYIARLESNGVFDPTFNANSTATYRGFASDITAMVTQVTDIELQPDGKILAAGIFRQFNGTNVRNIARLTANGNLDTSFVTSGFENSTPGIYNEYNMVRDIDLVTTGTDYRLYAAGDFFRYNNANCNEMIRISCSGMNQGSNDINFRLRNAGTNGNLYCMKRQGDGKIIIGGNFRSFNGITAEYVTRILPSNASDQARMSGQVYVNEVFEPVSSTLTMQLYPNPTDGKVYISSDTLDAATTQVEVYNTMGQKVGDVAIENHNELNLAGYKSGTYFITFTSPTARCTKTIIVK
jgi:uncharacterized repeat protein (TIGR01451 family)/uncharacterized delta-60 repeat protein